MPETIPPPRTSGFTETTTSPVYWCACGPASAERLLVLHGGPGAHHDYLLPQMLHLAKRYNVILYDQRGGGRSKSDDREHITWKTHVMDLHAIIREFAIPSPSIVAYSFGGMLALLYAIESRKHDSMRKPSRLALIDTAPVRMEYRKEFEAEFSRRQNGLEIRKMREALAASGLREQDPEEYKQRAFELAVAPYFSDPSKARNLTPFRVAGRVQTSTWDSLGADYNLVPNLKPMGFPVMFIHGRDDPIPTASSKEGAEAMGGELVLLDDCGHVPYVEQPGQLFAALDRFLAATDSK
jgi:Predicted hydrolases or acyltransferases (alpha/beta hydrolase superfamily)